MAAHRITVTLDCDQIKKVRALVRTGRAESVSAFVRHAVKNAILDADGWRAMLDEALQSTGGPLTDEERAWADSVLDSAIRRREGVKPKKQRAPAGITGKRPLRKSKLTI